MDSLYDMILITGQQATNKRLLPYALLKQGVLSLLRNENNNALKKYFEFLKTSEKINYAWGIATAHNKIGNVYLKEKNRVFAIREFHSSVYYARQVKDSAGLSEGYNDLGTIYKDLNQTDSSLFYHLKALEIRLVSGPKGSLASTYNNIGLVYKRKKEYDKALDYLYKALPIRTEINDGKGIAGANINIGNVLRLKKDYTQALTFIEKGTTIAYQNHANDFYATGLESRAECLYALKNYKESALAWEKFENCKDSLQGEKIKKDIAELQSKYDSDKKDANIKLKEEQIKFKTAQNSKQKILIIASVIALLLSLLAVFFIYRSFRLNKKNAIQLAFKNHLIEEKNKEITDSINYARLIQQSLLASEPMLDKNLSAHFILYQPKDIVSGDFYWASETADGFLIACVDCTGHGVPGAFMSLIGKENLDKAVVKTNSPKQILSELNKGVKKSLNQNAGNGNRDGMDAAIIRIERKEDDTAKVFYAGANRSILVLRNNGNLLQEIKPTKCAIGGFTADDQLFEEHTLALKSGDVIYMTTDGYADQFGGEKNKKMTTRRFKEFLSSLNPSNFGNQKRSLEVFFETWKGRTEQLDDLLVIGVKI